MEIPAYSQTFRFPDVIKRQVQISEGPKQVNWLDNVNIVLTEVQSLLKWVM